jgi:hypothetical protein
MVAQDIDKDEESEPLDPSIFNDADMGEDFDDDEDFGDSDDEDEEDSDEDEGY